MKFAVNAIVGLLSMIGVANAIEDPNRVYYDDFEQLFQVQTVKKTGLGVDDPWQPNGGNAITMSKDGKALLVTHRDGSLTFIDPATTGSIPGGGDAYIYPQINAVQLINDKFSTSIEYVECRSGIVLSPDGASENLIVYSVIEGVAAIGTPPLQTAVVDPKVSQSYLVIVKVPDDFAEPGSTLDIMVSDAIPGDVVGTPVLDRDAKYAYVTSNKKTASDDGNSTESSDQYNAGFLNVINTGTGGVDFQFPVNVPVSEAAIFHEPEEQFYGGGESDNTNDVVVFIERPSCRECSVDTPEQGEMFAFAFKGPSANPIDPEQLKSLGIKPFKGYMAPVIYNKGRSLILPVTAQNLRLWDNQKFSQNPAIRTPPGIPLRRAQRFEYPDPSSVTVLNDPTPASPVYVQDGNESFFVSNFGRFDVAVAKLNATDLSIDWFIPTETGTADFRSFAISKPVVTPDAEYILWTESGTGKNGKLHCVKADDGSAAFDSVTIPDITTADIALSNDGTTVYAIGDFGLLRAYKFADLLETEAPTDKPTRTPTPPTFSPTLPPTMAPVPTMPPVDPTNTPSMAPSGPPVPTESPTEAPTDAPEPTEGPSEKPAGDVPTLPDDPIAESCVASGGVVEAQLCCTSSDAYPVTCGGIVGACGCGPADSEEKNVCTCPEGSCFDGTECVLEDGEPTMGPEEVPTPTPSAAVPTPLPETPEPTIPAATEAPSSSTRVMVAYATTVVALLSAMFFM